MDYTKQYTPPAELLRLLSSRGLDCTDVPDAQERLESIGYYRLSGYLYPFLGSPKDAHRYKAGSTLGAALNLYEFDRRLRLLVFDQVERIEVAVRSAIVNITCAEIGDVFWLTNPKYFANPNKFTKMMTLIDKELHTTREDFIAHFKTVYDNPYPPSWMIAEIIPLGVLTQVYDNIASNKTRKRIAAHFALNIPVFTSWMTIITVTRNTCGHHARLWNRCLSLRALTMTRPVTPWVSSYVRQGRIFFTLCILQHFVRIIYPANTFKHDLLHLLSDFPMVNESVMGFPDKWKAEPLWK